MRIVLDTNVLVSGLLNPYGAPGRIVSLVAAGELNLCFDVRILAEYREVLARPAFNFRNDHVDALLEQIRSSGACVSPLPLSHRLPDADDEQFLEAALAGGANYLVTGNPRHFPMSTRGSVSVVVPAQFMQILRTKR